VARSPKDANELVVFRHSPSGRFPKEEKKQDRRELANAHDMGDDLR
jgi:hypothetical protein